MNRYFVLLSFLFSLNLVVSQTKTNLFNYDKKIVKKAAIVQKKKINTVSIFEKIVLEGFDSKIPFYHFINTSSDHKKYVILLHGIGGSKKDWVNPSEPYLNWSRDLTAIKDSLITLGYNIIIPDAKFHGERNYELNFRPPETLPPGFSKNKKDSKHFKTLITSTVKDVRIIMDYIQLRNQNLNQKFNIIGYSLGGNLAILLSNFDKRITSIVACVSPINLPSRSLKAFNWSKELMTVLENITPMTHVELQKAPILLLMGKKDFFALDKEVTSFFNSIPTKHKELKYFDSGHTLPSIYKNDVIRWIKKYNN